MISFVIVHIGKKEFPKHIYDCVSQIRCFHENNDIYLVVNKSVKNMDMDRLNNLNCNVVYIESLKKTKKHRKWSLTTRLKKFWKYTAERFFVLEELMDAYNLEHVVQVESDNLVYYDWNLLENKLEILYPELTATAESNEYCVASVMWINKISAIADLTQFLTLKEAKDCSNEMFMLRKYLTRKHADVLPILYKPDMSSVLTWSEFGKNIDQLNGIFDAIAIGQYIGGADKRTYIDILHGKYDAPISKEFNEYINPNFQWEQVDIKWVKDDVGRYVPILENETKIYNLHIHSKELFKYASRR